MKPQSVKIFIVRQSSATDFVTDVTDVRKKEGGKRGEGRRKEGEGRGEKEVNCRLGRVK